MLKHRAPSRKYLAAVSRPQRVPKYRSSTGTAAAHSCGKMIADWVPLGVAAGSGRGWKGGWGCERATRCLLPILLSLRHSCVCLYEDLSNSALSHSLSHSPPPTLSPLTFQPSHSVSIAIQVLILLQAQMMVKRCITWLLKSLWISKKKLSSYLTHNCFENLI